MNIKTQTLFGAHVSSMGFTAMLVWRIQIAVSDIRTFRTHPINTTSPNYRAVIQKT
jgi:hypothetical protein